MSDRVFVHDYVNGRCHYCGHPGGPDSAIGCTIDPQRTPPKTKPCWSCGKLRTGLLSTRTKPLPICAGQCYDLPPGIAHLEYAGEDPHMHYDCEECGSGSSQHQLEIVLPPEYRGSLPGPPTARTWEQQLERALQTRAKLK